MNFVHSAQQLALNGFHIFPLIPNSKLPAVKDFPNRATRDPAQIQLWWKKNPAYNIGISTTHYGENEALLVVDVDNKGEKKGDDELLRLELEGQEFPNTLEQRTPTGGRHLIYRVAEAVKQGSDVLARGLDVRSRGGYIVGAGSSINGRAYSAVSRDIGRSPDWLVSRCGRSVERKNIESEKPRGVDPIRSESRAIHFLQHEAPLALEGESGDQTTFQVAARVKDFGVDAAGCTILMNRFWNHRCSPPWSMDDLITKVENAYRYGTEPAGVAAPEKEFSKIVEEKALHPFEKLNKEFAFVIAGGGSHILWETKDHRAIERLEHLAIPAFHQKLAAQTMNFGERSKPISEIWMKSEARRSYDGICFMPGLLAPPRFYNLWRGFSVQPLGESEKPTHEMQDSLDAFLDHAKTNICRGDVALTNWLITYFAHLVQKPWEKPLVALVFRGGKGVGKNALIERVGALLGNHFMVTSDRRYLVGNFNGHLENMLLFTLDEAFWSGDKQAEGVLKNLITGKTHVVEHKGKEPYTVENCTRVAIIGNEEWLVPATQDERRYAVFDVGDGRKQDRAYFRAMRESMERGGYRLLLRFLLTYDISKADIDHAPSTHGLMEQKIASLEPFQQWWLDCLGEGRILGSDFGGDWHTEVSKDRLRDAFRRHARERNIRGRFPEDRSFGRFLKACAPSVVTNQKKREEGEVVNIYRLPDLAQARREWQQFIGHSDMKWE